MFYCFKKLVIDNIKNVLQYLLDHDLVRDDSLYISFFTNQNGVVLSKQVKKKYPTNITIVIEKIDTLKVHDGYFEIELSFFDKYETVRVPYDSVNSLISSKYNFMLRFDFSDYTHDIIDDAVMNQDHKTRINLKRRKPAQIIDFKR